MSEIFIPSAFWTIILFPIVVLIWQIRHVRRSTISRGRTVISFLLISTAPVMLYALIFLLAVAIEEISGISLVAEGYARSLLLMVAINIAWVSLMTAVFAVLVMFMSHKRL